MARRASLAAIVLAVFAGGAPARADDLRAGAGRADITPPTGYPLWGWVRSDATAEGQHTRLFARAIVLASGRRKLALVATDLGATPGGLVVDVAERLAGRGFSERDLIVSASHTHSGPGGYSNYHADNFVAPTRTTPTEFDLGGPPDPRLYTFLARRIAAAIRRADEDLGPARAGWGEARLLGVTQNRSLAAHLANHGIERGPGRGSVEDDPHDYPHTIDPEVSVLRVDKRLGGRWVPIGIWSEFANHGTVVKYTFDHYTADHHAAAERVVERTLRRRRRVPRSQELVNAYGNSDQGDVAAGIKHTGPAGAERVGRREARTMIAAWRDARRSLDRDPRLARRWTRVCFCGQETAAGRIDDQAVLGIAFLTGSEENRGPLYDVVPVVFEGYRLPVSFGPQGTKVPGFADPGGQFASAAPLTAAQIGNGAIVTAPGELTIELGRRLRVAALERAGGSGIERVAIAGLANEHLHYFTTPEEYDAQHYEGASMLHGRAAGVFLSERLGALLADLAARRPAPPPAPFDPKNGVDDGARHFGRGARRGSIVRQPSTASRLGHSRFVWRGGRRGLDRPLDRPFVTVERQTPGGGWTLAATDLGLEILWSVDDEGTYTALWEAPRSAPLGGHRFVVRANRYRLVSEAFELSVARTLRARVVRSGGGEALVELRYPQPVENRDLTWRPTVAPPGALEPRSDGGTIAVSRVGKAFRIEGPADTRVIVGPGEARDRFGNANSSRIRFEL